MGGRTFSARLLNWFDAHGRHDLPWQQDRDPYLVWLSEIMLQQTQVATVIPYFERFRAHFPDVESLALAPVDEVLHLWSGLGYYARARNLHRAAGLIVSQYDGVFPDSVELLMALPGIGESTAGAICAQAFGQRAAILDGNVKRVLARYHAVDGWPDRSEVKRSLWELADRHTPHCRVADYTQAIMDLGATVCTRNRPGCDLCPLRSSCQARQLDAISRYPARKPKRALPVRQTRMLIIRDGDGAVLLQQRPGTGIWGGLWSLPETGIDENPAANCELLTGRWPHSIEEQPGFRHSFTHYHLDILPTRLLIKTTADGVSEPKGQLWYQHGKMRLGLAAPVSRLLNAASQED